MFIFFKKIKYYFYLIPLYFLLAKPVMAASLWENYTKRLETAAGVKEGGFRAVGETTLAEQIGAGIFLLITLVGTVFLILVVYGGFIWMLARGNTDEIDRAKKIIINASIGLGVTLFAYLITRTIVAIFV